MEVIRAGRVSKELKRQVEQYRIMRAVQDQQTRKSINKNNEQ